MREHADASPSPALPVGADPASPDGVLGLALDALRERLSFDGAALQVLEGEAMRVVAVHGRPSSGVGQALLLASYPYLHRLADDRSPIVVPDTTTDPLWVADPDLRDIRSFLGVPLLIGDRLLGALTLEARRPGQFTAADARTAMPLARLAAAALQGAFSFRLEREAHEQADRLLAATRALSSTMDVQEVYARILSEVRRVVPYDCASIQELREGDFVVVGGVGFPDVAATIGLRFSVESGESPNREVARSCAPVILEDAPRLYPSFRTGSPAVAGIRSWIGVPLLFGDRLTGMLTLDKREPAFYTEAHARRAQEFASQAAIALEHSRLYAESRRAGAAIQASEEQFRSLFEDAPIALREEDFSEVKQRVDALRAAGILDLLGFLDEHPEELHRCLLGVKVVRVNRAALDLAQASSPDAFGQGLADMFTAESHQTFKEALCALAAGRSRFDAETTALTVQGARIDIGLRLYLLTGTEESWSRVLVAITDLTERKRAEAALRRSEADLKLALDAGRLGDWKWDILTGEVTWSPLCKALYGLPPEEEVSYERFLAAVHPDDREATQAALERAVEARTDYDIEKRIVWPDGSVRWTASRGRVFCDQSGRPVRMAGVTMDTTEHKRADEALRESERRLAEAQRVAHVGYWERDLDTDTLSWSAETFRIYGLPPREGSLPRSEVWPQVHPEDRSRLARAAEEAVGGGSRYDVEFRLIRPDGSMRIVHSQGDLTRNGSGRPRRLFGTVQDITERKQAEEALRESERRLAEAQRIAHVGYWDRDLETDRSNWSIETFHIFGLKVREGALDLHEVWERIHPEDRSRVTDMADGALRGGPRYDLEYRVIRPDGSMRIVHSQGDLIRDPSGRPHRMFGTVQDITARRQAELELRASEARFRALVDHATDAFFLHDDRGTILDVNQQACESLGYSRDELVGMTPYQFDVDASPSFLERMAARLEAGEVVAFDSGHRRKDGTVFPVEVRVRPFEHGGRRFAVSLARDITERRRHQEQLESSLREKESLLRELHHRVKNNLQVVSSLLNLQARRVKDKQTLEALRESQNRIRSMALVHEMLYRAKGLPRIDARAYASDLVANVFRSYGARSDLIRLRSAVEPIELGIDLALPVGLLLNELVSNALKHAFPDQREGEIQVELGPSPEGGLVLRVSDTGVGLPPGRGADDHASLGFELVRAVTEQLGASLRVTGDRGTSVEVTVPPDKGA